MDLTFWMQLKHVVAVQVNLSLIWAQRIKSWPPLKLSFVTIKMPTDMLHLQEIKGLKVTGSSTEEADLASWWINLFKDLVETGDLNTSDELQKGCLWFCIAELLQEDLNAVKEHWNTRGIRKSRNDTVAGVPDVLYYLPEGRGGESGLLLSVDDNKISYVENHLIKNRRG